MKDTENYEELLERFYKRTMQLEDRQADLEDAYQEYIKLTTQAVISYGLWAMIGMEMAM